MAAEYEPHHTFDSRDMFQRPPTGADISDYIPLQVGREDPEKLTPFNVIRWLCVFFDQQVPPLPVIPLKDIEEIPDQQLQETMDEYRIFTPTVRGVKLNPFTEIGIKGFPLIEDTVFNVVRSYPADEQYRGPHSLIWLVSNSYWRAGNYIIYLTPLSFPSGKQKKTSKKANTTLVAWAIFGNWELWPHVKAQHRLVFQQVLSTPNHPRHTLYRGLNEKFKGHNNLNIKDRLGIPYCAIRHDDIQQVTADIYGIFLVIFTFRPEGQGVNFLGYQSELSERHYAPTLRGEFNRPHVLIRLSISTVPEKFEDHPDAKLLPLWEIYEPLMLNMPNFRHADFKYTLPTVKNTRKSLPHEATLRPVDFNGVKHPWRAVNVPWEKTHLAQQTGIPNPLTQVSNWPGAIPIKPMSLTVAMGCILLEKGDPKDPKSWAYPVDTIKWIRPDKKLPEEKVESAVLGSSAEAEATMESVFPV
ncbi:hypothetical protein BCIN_01g07370 [Botrytis cinerea B05.10]|uniref:Uncharacterized protein n=2 Tax=Botryotinia fuckeliana TaxID=40559 RepID=A0A384J6A2_BOTFB|nr:hypothetical protein BCIN_01g07370 [Botrytis cinerea B05.10]ATZ46063.1 hypothetical protein BCIN_01g07370 [Botrytis cinerea B05.10]EMR84425.1 hypothetical protein BcDW1_6935 [Botrytis cinerea BcDW1]